MMYWSAWRYVVTAISLCASAGLAQDDAPSTATFLRRTNARATVLGDYVYFDGGEISQRKFVDTELRPSNPVNEVSTDTEPVNSTLSIDVSTSWRPGNVTIIETSKPDSVPVLLRQGLFTDEATNSFYIWGGMGSYAAPPARSTLFRFCADGLGSGSWTTKTPENPDLFASLHRAEGGAFASSPDAGYWVGGRSTRRTTPEDNPPGDVTGVLSLNFSTAAWRNDSSAPATPDGTLYGASATYVPPFRQSASPNGIIMLLGGTTRAGKSASGHVDFKKVTFFDPVTREWYKQKTTGTFPRTRYDHCAVGVEGRDGTYEIFVFGGRNDIYGDTFDDVHVLTLPGFHWAKASYEPRRPRAEQACVLAGNRQMLSIGGINAALDNPEVWEDEDPFPQGIGIFDMSDMRWKTEFEADAAPYRTPQSIRAWYEEGGLESVEWENDSTNALFAQLVTDGDVDDNDNSNDNDENDDSNPQNDDDDDDSPSIPVGIIAGTAVGGVVGLALIGAVACILVRRHRRGRGEKTKTPGGLPKIEVVDITTSNSHASHGSWPIATPRTAPLPSGWEAASGAAPPRPPRPPSVQSPGPVGAPIGLALGAGQLSPSSGPGPDIGEPRGSATCELDASRCQAELEGCYLRSWQNPFVTEMDAVKWNWKRDVRGPGTV